MKRKNCFFYIVLLAAIFFTALSSDVTAEPQSIQKRYVRQKQQPNFFIPQKAINTPSEKLHMPKVADYKNTEPTTKHVSTKANIKPTKTVTKTQIKKPIRESAKNNVPADMPEEEISPQDALDTYQNYLEDLDDIVDDNSSSSNNEPEYQKKYQDYLEDLGELSKTGKIHDKRDVYSDLSAMNSDDLIKVDKNFNQKRTSPKSKIQKSLKKSLQ